MNSSNSWKKGSDTTITKVPCKLCPKNVSDNNNAILCDLCQTWVHIKCNHLNYIVYKNLQGCNEPWHCFSCATMLFPFDNLNNQSFLDFINNSESKNSSSSLILKPPPSLVLFKINLTMSFLRITVIRKMWYKVNIMTLMNCNNWKFPIKKHLCLFFMLIPVQ